MSEVCPNEVENIEEINVISQKKVTKVDPISFFANNTSAARFWFFGCVLLFLFILIQPSLIMEKMNIRERNIIMDESGTFHVAPVLKFEEAGEMHDYILSVATQAFLNRGPNDVDNDALLKQLFLDKAYVKAQDYLKEESTQFKKKKIHQKVEISELIVKNVTKKTVLGYVRGQLIRVGTFEGKKFTDTKEFQLKLNLFRNPNLTANGRLPMAVLQWAIKKRDYVDRVEETKPLVEAQVQSSVDQEPKRKKAE